MAQPKRLFHWPWVPTISEAEKDFAKKTQRRVAAQEDHVGELHEAIVEIVTKNNLGDKFSKAFTV